MNTIDAIGGASPNKKGFRAFFEDYFRIKIKAYAEDAELVGVYFNISCRPSDSYLCAVVKSREGYLFADEELNVIAGPFDKATPLYVKSVDQMDHAAKMQKEDWLKVVRRARSELIKLETSTFGSTNPVYVGDYSYSDACLVTRSKASGIVSLAGKIIVPLKYSFIYPFRFVTGASESSFFNIYEGDTSLYVCYAENGDHADVYDTSGNLIFDKADFLVAERTVTSHTSYKTAITNTDKRVESVRVSLKGKEYVVKVEGMCNGNAVGDVVLHQVTAPPKNSGRELDEGALKGEYNDETMDMLKRLAGAVADARGVTKEKVMGCIYSYGLFLRAEEMKSKITRDSPVEQLCIDEELCEKLHGIGLNTARDLLRISNTELRLKYRKKLDFHGIASVRELKTLLEIIFA